jgi:hypothetical protein
MEGQMTKLQELKNIVHEPNVIEFQAWQSVHDTITAPMITALGDKDAADSHLAIGFAYITKPDTLGGDTHEHPFDQWIFLIGAEGNNFLEFDADVDMFLDTEYKKVNYSGYFFIPKGMKHCPLVVKRVGKPIIFIDARITKEASVRSTKK